MDRGTFLAYRPGTSEGAARASEPGPPELETGLSTQSCRSPRLSLALAYARRLEDDDPLADAVLPRVSLTRMVGGRPPVQRSWVASPRGCGASVRSARESMRLQFADESNAGAVSERQLASSLHRYVKGPVRHTGHRYTQPPRRLFEREPFDNGLSSKRAAPGKSPRRAVAGLGGQVMPLPLTPWRESEAGLGL